MKNVYAVKDLKVGYGSPFLASNDDEAKRMFRTAIRPGLDNPMSMYPEDYELWKLGTYNPENGQLISGGVEYVANAGIVGGAKQ